MNRRTFIKAADLSLTVLATPNMDRLANDRNEGESIDWAKVDLLDFVVFADNWFWKE